MYKEIDGDLIKLALKGEFDVIVHGCNCFCTMGAGIAVKMAETFWCNKYKLERPEYKVDINKLGNIDKATLIVNVKNGEILKESFTKLIDPYKQYITVVNAYTQYFYGQNSPACNQALDYEALTLCLRKINHIFKGKHIGLPQIGCGLAGGDWSKVSSIIKKELCDCYVTVVIYKV